MIENLVEVVCKILALKLQIMISCFAIVLGFVIVVLVGCLVWWILDEMGKRR
jgi:hypothetical protein